MSKRSRVNFIVGQTSLCVFFFIFMTCRNSSPASDLMVTFANSLDPDQDRQAVKNSLKKNYSYYSSLSPRFGDYVLGFNFSRTRKFCMFLLPQIIISGNTISLECQTVWVQIRPPDLRPNCPQRLSAPGSY